MSYETPVACAISLSFMPFSFLQRLMRQRSFSDLSASRKNIMLRAFRLFLGMLLFVVDVFYVSFAALHGAEVVVCVV